MLILYNNTHASKLHVQLHGDHYYYTTMTQCLRAPIWPSWMRIISLFVNVVLGVVVSWIL